MRTDSDLRLVVTGHLCSLDLALAEALLGAGVVTTVLRPAGLEPTATEREFFGADVIAAVETYGSAVALMRRLRSADFVYTHGSHLGFALGLWALVYPLLVVLRWPRYMNLCTGSDLLELDTHPFRTRRMMLWTMRRALTNALVPTRRGVAMAASAGVRNACVVPGIYPWRPDAAEATRPAADRWRFRRSPSELLFFHPSHLDWGVSDAAPGRASTKGNDRFLRAFARFVHETSRDVRCVILERGSDVDLARSLVAELGIERHVAWAPELSRAELVEAMAEADVVVDQFDVGCMGGIAWEALNVGRAVMIHIERDIEKLRYDQPAPVLNARTEEEILACLRRAADPGWLEANQADIRRWMRHRTPDSVVPRYLWHALLGAGRQPTIDA